MIMRRDSGRDGDGGAGKAGGTGDSGDGGDGVEAALDELYVTPPPAFVSRREGLATEAKAAGRVADARRIRAARRPSLAAWAANLLLRSRPEESRAFLDLGRALREAYGSLDAGGIKELSEQRRSVVAAMSRQTAELAVGAGHRLSDPLLREVEATLRAVLADQDAADRWATGRLQSALTPPADFPGLTAVRPDHPRKSVGAAPQSAPARKRAQDEVAEQRRRKQERLAEEKRDRLAKEKQQRLAKEKQERLAKEKEERLARERRERLGRAREAARAADRRLRQAREDLRRAERQQRAAEKQCAEAAEAFSRAEQAARDAASEVERLSGRTR
ncbi:hypothetical protein PV755_23385 [Streptomyces caniscabiei]|nr:hypothetical protein [Streptomyces caniscabiei]MDX3511833.1 hypothetical protein [Streptomyces caniscabiei]MDX3719382.1 hypothetical protein [Streptomyces caniscabiei]MDX3726199.1 hypothetical protein [Streptomyces caniscabiei]WEO29482.1 hypothetical protein IHE65_43425 [Streptomyces caniscabiei]